MMVSRTDLPSRATMSTWPSRGAPVVLASTMSSTVLVVVALVGAFTWIQLCAVSSMTTLYSILEVTSSLTSSPRVAIAVTSASLTTTEVASASKVRALMEVLPLPLSAKTRTLPETTGSGAVTLTTPPLPSASGTTTAS